MKVRDGGQGPGGASGKIVRGLDGDILIPDAIEDLRPDGFMLRFGAFDDIAIELLASNEDQQDLVIARLAFTAAGFERFVDGLGAVRDDLMASDTERATGVEPA